ncbi:MAG: hypothetical protein BGP13_18770 [Sphingobacteriales bacterium 40-81]|jgi:hypothetical protein|nr:MAG: hypothetical protein BGP13_18770 [Sphingobacteriales bacterium 40-81]
MLVKHVKKSATPVLKIAQDSQEWNSVKHNAGNVLMYVADVQRNVGMAVLIQYNNVPMPAVLVPKNAKSITMNIANVAQKNAEDVKLNAERLLLKFYEGFNQRLQPSLL